MGALGSDCGSGDSEKWANLGYFAVDGACLWIGYGVMGGGEKSMMTFKVFGNNDWKNRVDIYVNGQVCRGAGLGSVVWVKSTL